jgi:adenylate cyclase
LTRFSAGGDPQKVVEVLNRFLTLADNAVKSKGGVIDKFMGDGVMALFGTPRRQANHADQAVAAARELLGALRVLNNELTATGQKPLQIGIGIHTGLAVVGCIGSKVTLPDGRERMRRSFTAIGETVNLAQRLEQLTKTFEGPILISDQTRLSLNLPTTMQLRCHGEVDVPGCDLKLVVYQVKGK